MRKSLSLWIGLILISGLTGFIPPAQNAQPNITVLDRSGQSIQALTDGNQVQLAVRLPAPASASQEITFTLQGDAAVLGSCTIPAGAEECRTGPLLTLGWHWGEDGAARPVRLIQARDAAGNIAGISGSLKVAPRPVVLVHGFISSWEAWNAYLGPQGFLASLGLPAYAVGDGQVPGQMNTGSLTDPPGRTNSIQQNAGILGKYIAAVKQKTGAEMVDLVVHSMGGMISRYYIDRVMGGRDVGQLVMLGSPMGGSDCSVLPAALGFYLPASLEIRSTYMLGIFNRQIFHRHGIPFYDLAGTQILEAYQSPCAEVPNDTVVSLGSVNAIPLASTQIKAIHSELTTSPAVFQDYVQPLLKNPAGRFAPAADAEPSASTGAPLQFTRLYRGHVDAGGSTELTINIEADISVAAFALYDPTRTTAVSVRGASGNVIQLDPQTNGFIRIEDPASMLYLGYGFSNPKPGPWRVTVLATDATPAPGADFAISVYFVGGALLQASSDTLIPAVGTPVTWTASLTLGGQSVEIRQGQILIRRPDGGQETIEMQPGVQSVNTWTPPAPGTYGIDLVVTGQTPGGTPIERTAFLAIEAQPAAGTDKAMTNLALLIGGVVLMLALLFFVFIRLIQAVSRRARQVPFKEKFMTSSSYRNVGLTQFLLATGFVIWLVFMPGLSGHFAWPLGSRLSSMFIGACFALRAFEGWLMWRQGDWPRIRWMSWGTMAFLAVIFAATYWHIDLMNWVPFNIATVVWMIAYTAEPVVVPFVEPRGVELRAADLPASPPLSGGLQNLLTVLMTVAAAIFAMFFINPAKFITNYWPWPLTPFDARIASAFFAGILFWAARMKLAGGWSEVRSGMQGFILFFGAHFVIWVFNLATGQYDPARSLAAWVYGIINGLLASALLVFYLQNDRKA